MARRPHLEQFLEFAAQYFRLVAYTAAEQDYADLILDRIDPQGLIQARFYRQHCGAGPWPCKDLGKVGLLGPRTLLLDDNFENYLRNKDNTVRVRPFRGAETDQELPQLAEVLRRCLREGVGAVARAEAQRLLP